MKKMHLLLLLVLGLSACTIQSEPPKPNVYQYNYGDVNLMIVLDRSDLNRISQMVISKIEFTGAIKEDFDGSDDEIMEQFRQRYEAYEDVILSIDDANLIHANRGTGFMNFIALYLPHWDDVIGITTLDHEYKFTAKLFLDFDEYHETGCCGFDEIIVYLGLEQSVDLQNLYLDRLREDGNFIYHDIIDHEHGLALQYFEDDLEW